MDSLYREFYPDKPKPDEIPGLDQLIAWPETLNQQRIDEQRAQLEDKLANLRAKTAALEKRIATGDIMLVPQDMLGINSDDRDAIKAQRAAREVASKAKIFSEIDAIGLGDGESATAEYRRSVDHDLGGGYDHVHRVYIAKQAGVHILAEQITYDDVRGCNYVTSRGKKLLVHEALAQPLILETEGVFDALTDVVVQDTTPTQWEAAEDLVQDVTEAVRADRMIGSVLRVLPTDDLQPVTYENGHVDNSTLIAKRVAQLGTGVEVDMYAVYDRDYIPPSATEAVKLSRIGIQLKVVGEVKDRYTLTAAGLEVTPAPYSSYYYSGNKHLHSKAEGLLDLALAAIANEAEEG